MNQAERSEKRGCRGRSRSPLPRRLQRNHPAVLDRGRYLDAPYLIAGPRLALVRRAFRARVACAVCWPHPERAHRLSRIEHDRDQVISGPRASMPAQMAPISVHDKHRGARSPIRPPAPVQVRRRHGVTKRRSLDRMALTQKEQAQRAGRVTPRRAGMTAVGSPALVALGRVLGAAGTTKVLTVSAPDDSVSWTTEGCAPGTRRNVHTGQIWPIPEVG
jgi:hypothetical protein